MIELVLISMLVIVALAGDKLNEMENEIKEERKTKSE